MTVVCLTWVINGIDLPRNGLEELINGCLKDWIGASLVKRGLSYFQVQRFEYMKFIHRIICRYASS